MGRSNTVRRLQNLAPPSFTAAPSSKILFEPKPPLCYYKMMLQKFLRKNLRFTLNGIILLALFYAFSFLLVKGGGLSRFDFDMTVKIQAKVPLRLDPYLSILSLLGSFEVMLGILVLFFIVKRKIQGALVVGIFSLMHVVELVGKAFLDHPPTPFMFHRYALNFLFPTGYVQPGGSYPSGHAMRSAFLAVLFIFFINKRTNLSPIIKQFSSIAILLFYLVMSISRISLGEHWTSDVIGGSILGSAFAFLSLIFI